jgi:hypothetical protein
MGRTNWMSSLDVAPGAWRDDSETPRRRTPFGTGISGWSRARLSCSSSVRDAMGSPIDCDVFIVGYNPATAMDGDWWGDWRPGRGFDRDAWWTEYLAQRGGKPSKTRKRSNAIVSSLGGVRCLEANIDARPSKKKSEYPNPVTAPFDFVLSTCRPKVIVAHGVDAVRHLPGRASAYVIECDHFIRVGERRMKEIVDEVQDALRKG